MKKRWLVLILFLIGLSGLAFISEREQSEAKNCQSGDKIDQLAEQNKQLSGKNAELTALDVIALKDYVALKNYTWALKAKLDAAIDARDGLLSIIEDRDSYIKRIQELSDDSKGVPEEARQAVTQIHVTFRGTFADLVRFFDIPYPPLDANEQVTFRWDTFGTLIDAESLGPKIVTARHALYANGRNENDLRSFLTVSVLDARTNSTYDVPIDGLTEFADLDLVVFDAPSELHISPLPLHTSYVHNELLAHVYAEYDDNADKWTVFVQPTITRPHFGLVATRDGHNFNPADYMSLSGRFMAGDSGGPVLLKKDGITYVAGFVLMKHTGTSDDGIAIRADKLYSKLLESQRSP